MDVVLAGEFVLDRLFEQPYRPLEPEPAVRRCDCLQVLQRCLKAAGRLRIGTGGKPDLVKRQAHVSVPVKRANHEPQLAVVVHVLGRGERPRRELTKAVMKSADHLHGRGGVILPVPRVPSTAVVTG